MSYSKKLLPEDFWKQNALDDVTKIVSSKWNVVTFESGSTVVPLTPSSVQIIDYDRIVRTNINRISDGSVVVSTSINPIAKEFLGLSNVSEISITPQGILSEKWDVIENIPSSIVAVGESYLTLECLIDVDRRHFQKRIFDIILFKGVVKLEIGKLILVKIFKRAGEIKFKFLDGTGLVNPEYFDAKKIKDYFKDIPKGKLDKHYKFNSNKG